MSTAPYVHLPGQGEAVHFYHANGFPAGVYMPFLKQLNQHFNVYAMNNRATWPDHNLSKKPRNWQPYANDLIDFIEHHHSQPITAIGHSMGASATVLAASKRPDLFKALVLIEPAMVELPMSLLMKLLPQLVRKAKLIQGTLNKTDNWNDRESYLAFIKKFSGYKHFPDATFEAFSHNAVKENDGKMELVFSNEWEAHNYTQAPYLMPHLKKLEKNAIPTLAIRGAANKFFASNLWPQWQKVQPSALFKQDENYGHLMPLEAPEDTVEIITNGLKKLGKL